MTIEQWDQLGPIKKLRFSLAGYPARWQERKE
jgi:hypothetical protein